MILCLIKGSVGTLVLIVILIVTVVPSSAGYRQKGGLGSSAGPGAGACDAIVLARNNHCRNNSHGSWSFPSHRLHSCCARTDISVGWEEQEYRTSIPKTSICETNAQPLSL